MKDKVRIGWVGFGRRGRYTIEEGYGHMDDVEIVALCDNYEPILAEAKELLDEIGHKNCKFTTNYQDLLDNPEIDAIIIMTPWLNRIEKAIKAMRAGKYAAIEVGSAYDIQECHDLVRAYEETGVPCMMLENCCYGRREMMAYNMAEQGLFGEIVHCEGEYGHYLLNGELFRDLKVGRHYRLHEYALRNCDQYATHELGPISKILKLNRGNKMLTLSSMASKARGIKQYVVDNLGEDSPYAKTDYKQGDIVSTNIKCMGGETIHLTLDTTLPRGFYSRNFCVRGTRGNMFEDANFTNFPGIDEKDKVKGNLEKFMERFDHPLHAEYRQLGEKEGHEGIDWLVARAFIEAVKNGTNTPIDVYDTALWLSIGPLTEASIAMGGAPVPVPDFTKGKWTNREPIVEGKYCLDKVCEDKSVKIY